METESEIDVEVNPSEPDEEGGAAAMADEDMEHEGQILDNDDDPPLINIDEEFPAAQPARPNTPGDPADVNLDLPFMDRFAADVRDRERREFEYQNSLHAYMRYLRGMFDTIDRWMADENRGRPFPYFIEFAHHNWMYHLLPWREQNRINRLRTILSEIEDRARQEEETRFFEEADGNEEAAHRSHPMCSICLYDLRNASFVAVVMMCGHMFHRRCINRHLQTVNTNCPICGSFQMMADGVRVFMSFNN